MRKRIIRMLSVAALVLLGFVISYLLYTGGQLNA